MLRHYFARLSLEMTFSLCTSVIRKGHSNLILTQSIGHRSCDASEWGWDELVIRLLVISAPWDTRMVLQPCGAHGTSAGLMHGVELGTCLRAAELSWGFALPLGSASPKLRPQLA